MKTIAPCGKKLMLLKRNCKPEVVDVQTVYASGSVRTTSGDVFRVKPSRRKGVDYVAHA